MKPGRKFVLMAVSMAALAAPATARADWNFGAGNDDICLVSQSGVNKICLAGGSPSAMSGDYVVNGEGDNDRIRIRGAGDCSCTCSGAGIDDFIYDDDVTLNGGTGDDNLYGADAGGFLNFLVGGDGNDNIRGSSGDDDVLNGDGGADYLYDAGGSSDLHNGGAGDDHLRDIGCDINAASTCGGNYDYWYPCGGTPPTACEASSGLFSLSCP